MAAVQVWFAGGNHRVAHANATARQDARTWVRSFVESGDGALDLRKRKDAARLLRELGRMDLSPITGGPARRS